MTEGNSSSSVRTDVRPEIEVVCSLCREPIQARGGALGIDLDKVLAAERAQYVFEESHSDGHGGTFSSLGDLLALPPSVAWQAWHWGCNPDADALVYEVPVEHMRTWRQVANWTAHLMEKSWLPHSTWGDILRALASGSDAILREVRQAS